MTVLDLIARLQQLPHDAEVHTVNYDGCVECNPEGMPAYHEVTGANFQAEGHYPFHRTKNFVVLS